MLLVVARRRQSGGQPGDSAPLTFQGVQQHTVTRAYLSAFTDPATPAGQEPFLWVYEREGDAPYRRAPHKVAVKPDYYTATVDGKREDVVEEALSQVEDKALPIIRALATGGNPADLTEQERAALALFVGFLETRVPKFREWVERNVSELMRKVSLMTAAHPAAFERTIREAARAKGKEPPADIEAVRQFVLSGEYDLTVSPLMSLQMMVAQAPHIAELAYDFEWRVLDAPDGEVFITSDAPLVRIATERPQAAWMGIGWLTPWMEATLPLSPTASLLISQHHPTGREQVNAERVREANWRTAAYAQREVYSSRSLPPEQLNRPKDWNWWTPLTAEVLPRFVEQRGT